MPVGVVVKADTLVALKDFCIGVWICRDRRLGQVAYSCAALFSVLYVNIFTAAYLSYRIDTVPYCAFVSVFRVLPVLFIAEPGSSF